MYYFRLYTQVDGDISTGLPGDYERKEVKCPTVGVLSVYVQVSKVHLKMRCVLQKCVLRSLSLLANAS